METITSLLIAIAEKLRQKPKTRNILAIISFFFFLVSMTWMTIGTTYFPLQFIEIIRISTAISGLTLFIVIISYTGYSLKKYSGEEELENIKHERDEIIEKISQKDNNTVDTVRLSLNQIKEYYTINLNQAKSSYNWSVTAITFGFVLIVIGISWLFFSDQQNLSSGLIASASGIISEFIGLTYLLMYNKSLKQLNMYFRELINIQDTLLAVEICEKLDSTEAKKIEITEKIILALIGRSSVRQ